MHHLFHAGLLVKAHLSQERTTQVQRERTSRKGADSAHTKRGLFRPDKHSLPPARPHFKLPLYIPACDMPRQQRNINTSAPNTIECASV